MNFGLSVSQAPVLYLFQTVSATARILRCLLPDNGWNLRSIKAFYTCTAIDETTDLECAIAQPNDSYIARNYDFFMMLDSIDPDFEILTETTEQYLIRFMNNWSRMSEKRDTAALDRMLPEDLVITASDGRVLNKQQFLDTLKKIPEGLRITDYDQTVQIFDHTAIVRAGYELEIAGNVKRLRYTATFIKRRGRWEVVSLQSSLLIND